MSGIELSPAWTLIFGAALVPLLRGLARKVWVLALPIAGLVQLWLLAPGEYGQFAFLGEELLLLRVDRWSQLFGLIFLIAALVSAIYSLHVRDAVQQTAGLSYAGAAIGAVFAGDLLTLFVFWELTAVTSVFLIWARGTERAWRAGMRYILIQLVSGMLLLFGALQQLAATGSLRFEHLGLDAPGGMLIFLAFGIKCAFPLLHNWLQDAYPEATETGTVFLSAFTTKLAVYALARGYAGTPELIWIGAAMTAFPIFYAVIENDLRRVLAYSLNNQLGFMMVGIGIGTELALNGTAAHAFSHIL
ncbi:MAG TPA: proton-conducting transporter membrane subunit, partial [Burkholderiales bacterium]